MIRPPLSDTLLELIDALASPDGAAGVVLVGAEMTVPLELSLANEDGVTVLRAAPPVSIWRSGFENPVHRLRITAIAIGEDEPFVPDPFVDTEAT